VAEAELRRAGILLEAERVGEASVSATTAAESGAAMFDRGLAVLAHITAGLAAARSGGDPEAAARAALEAASSAASESGAVGGAFLERPDIARGLRALADSLVGTGRAGLAAEITRLLDRTDE